MKKTYIYLIIFVAVSSLTLSSCKKYLDVNTNPNTVEKVDPKLLFTYAVTSYVNLKSSGDHYIPFALAGQAVATGGNNPTGWGIPSEEQYQISSFSNGNSWRAYYTSIGSNLKEAIKLSESASPVNNNAAAQCKILFAMVGYEITTVFGDVPFSEAWSTTNPAPHFDAQKDIFESCLKLIDEALAQFDAASPLKIDKEYDMFYNGDLDRWKKLANSVKLRILMTMVDKDPSKAAAIGTLVQAGNLIDGANGNCLVKYESGAGKRNPKYALALQYNDGTNFFFGTIHTIDFLKKIKDPRLPKFFDKPAKATDYFGVENGADADDKVNARISTSLQTAEEPEVLFSYQEELFYEAEVYARGIGVPVNLTKADELFKKAVKASCLFYGVLQNVADDYVNPEKENALPSLIGDPTAVKTIQMHHWVDKMERGLDAFTQWRRSGAEGDETPKLKLPIGAPAGGLFRRFEYPITNEISANPNAPKTRIRFTEKVWFDL